MFDQAGCHFGFSKFFLTNLSYLEGASCLFGIPEDARNISALKSAPNRNDVLFSFYCFIKHHVFSKNKHGVPSQDGAL